MSLTGKAALRRRLIDMMDEHLTTHRDEGYGAFIEGGGKLADAIMREFALRPVAQGVVDSESGEVTGTRPA